MKSRLLQLPGELRNRIFEYALTFHDGICYRESELFVGWLCLHPQHSERDAEEQGHPPAVVASVGKPEDRTLALKRRKIIETGWTIDKPVADTKEMTRPALVTVNGHIVANHQLRSETKALVIRYNDIHILDAQRHLTELIYSVVGHKRLWIQKIIQRVRSDGDMSNLHNLRLDEEMHPRFRVHVCIPDACLEENNFFMIALYLQHSGRRYHSFVDRLTQAVPYQQILRNAPGRFPKIPSYVKIFPWDRKFDEAAIRRYCETNGAEQRFLVPTAPNGIDGMVAIAKEWFENGY